MKVLIAIPCLLKGGTEQQTLQLVKVLNNVGHKVQVICYFEFDDTVVTEFNKNNCEIVLLKLNRTISSFKLITVLKNVFKKNNPALIHVQYMAPGMLPIIAARLAGVKNVIATVHQPYTTSHGVLSKLLLRFSAFLSSHFTVISLKSEESWFRSASLYDEGLSLKEQPKHFTIYNTIDIKKIQNINKLVNVALEKEKQDIPDDALVFGVVARLRHEKGIDVLLRAFNKLVKENSNVHLNIVGGGPDETKLKEMVTEMNLLKQVTFFGETNWETAMQQMALMDVVVVPSRYEGFGLTAAEAGAMGIPVIASKVFGLQEVVKDQHTGLLFENENEADLYEKMSRLLFNKKELKYFSANAIKYTQQFGLPNYEKKIQSLYAKL